MIIIRRNRVKVLKTDDKLSEARVAVQIGTKLSNKISLLSTRNNKTKSHLDGEPKTFIKKMIMAGCLIKVLEDHGIPARTYSDTLTVSSKTPFVGFNGMHVHFSFNVVKNQIKPVSITIGHNIFLPEEPTTSYYAKMTKQMRDLHKYSKEATRYYHRVMKNYTEEDNVE